MKLYTLVLTPTMRPHRIVNWQTAICLLYTDKIDVLEEYDEVVASPSVEYRIPAVARLRRHVGEYKKAVKFSRVNVLLRDKFACCYCGRKLPIRELNYDHVVPRVQGGKTNWLNIVISCVTCNTLKAGRTPEQAGMRLIREPYKPSRLPIFDIQLRDRADAPNQWVPYLPVEANRHE